MSCADDCHGDAPAEAPRFWNSGPVRASLLAWAFVALGLLLDLAADRDGLAVAFYAAAVVSGAFYFARESLEELLKEREIGIELLMTVAIAGAAALGQWREAALVACLFSITEALEGFTIRRTRHAIRRLMDHVPPKARLVRGGVETEVEVRTVQVGDRIRIRPGESIPVDGLIREGSSAIDESTITGESMPVDRADGDPVYAGTLNGNGSLLVEANKRFEDNTVSKIIELVEKAQSQKGRSQLFVERFGRIYSPAVLLTAGLVALVPWLVGLDAAAWAQRAVSFLVAASPCALAVATPVTLVAALGSAARRGVLIKGGVILEALARARAVALDKTGTLTHGRPAVRDIWAAPGEENGVLALAAAVEHHSEHPLAEAIVAAARERKLNLRDVDDFAALTAAGVAGTVGGKRVLVLKPSAATERSVGLPAEAARWLAERQASGQSVVVVAEDGRFRGLISLADTVRPEARVLVARLRRAGIRHIVLLTGDNPGTAQAVGGQVGTDEIHASLLPAEKVSHVEDLRRRFGGVIMVGDGINDAPALAAASVGIAMGTGGSDAAIAAADVALVADDLSKLDYVITLGRRTRRLILQNIALSLAIVVVLVAGTFTIDLSMLSAVIGHEGSEVLIILNGLRVALTRETKVIGPAEGGS